MVIFKWDELPESVRWVRVSDNKRVIVALQEKDDVGEGWTWHERPKSEEKPIFFVDWDRVPEWVNWVARDQDNMLMGFEEQPIMDFTHWRESWGKHCVLEKVCWHRDIFWQDTLTKRPDSGKKAVPTNDHAEIPVWIYKLNDGSGFIVKEEPVTEIGTFTLFARKFINVTEGEGL